jgi:aerobic-type carbon monoxide dehydrogenase small subunit (CoxS/CutS family)
MKDLHAGMQKEIVTINGIQKQETSKAKQQKSPRKGIVQYSYNRV